MERFWSWRDICAAKGTSISTEKREQQNDPAYPRKVKLSDFRVGFPDDEVRSYFETLRTRQIELDELAAL